MIPTIDQLLTLLTSTKVFDGVSWHIYDDFGGELTYGPDHWGGVHFALLTQIASAAQGATNNGWAANTVQGRAGTYAAETVDMKGYTDRILREQAAYNLTRLQQDDQDATEFVLSLFHMEFF